MGAYEDRVLGSTALQGVVLRYGFFYGPGTWYRPDGASAEQVRKGMSTIIGDGSGVWSFVHIDDAVAATVAAITAEPGQYNVMDDDPRSEESRVGQAWVSTCRSRWSPYH